MKHHLLFGTSILLASSLLAAAADSNPKDDVNSAAKKLSAESNYSWKATTKFNEFDSSAEGKAEKDGATSLSFNFADNTTEAALKGKKAALKTDRGWRTAEEAMAEAEGFGQFLPRMLQNYKLPAAEAEDFASKTKELKKDGDVYSGPLTDEGAKTLLAFGPNSNPRDAKGSVKFWVKDGALSKFEIHLEGKISGMNGEDFDVDRTTTVEIKDVGKTKVELSDEAKKKLS